MDTFFEKLKFTKIIRKLNLTGISIKIRFLIKIIK